MNIFKTIAVAAVAALVVALAIPKTQAAVSEGFFKGYWQLFLGTTNDTAGVCIMATDGVFPNGAGWSFSVKKFSTSDELQLWFTKTDWNVPADVSATVFMEFDNLGPWKFTAAGHDLAVSQGDNSILFTTIDLGAEDLFIEEFSKSSVAVIVFQGSENPWKLSMDGSTAVAMKFVECVNLLKLAPTQPFTKKEEPSQPFTATPTPTATQPFGV